MAIAHIPPQTEVTRADVVEHDALVAIRVYGRLPQPDDAITEELVAELEMPRDAAPGALIALNAIFGAIPVNDAGLALR